MVCVEHGFVQEAVVGFGPATVAGPGEVPVAGLELAALVDPGQTIVAGCGKLTDAGPGQEVVDGPGNLTDAGPGQLAIVGSGSAHTVAARPAAEIAAPGVAAVVCPAKLAVSRKEMTTLKPWSCPDLKTIMRKQQNKTLGLYTTIEGQCGTRCHHLRLQEAWSGMHDQAEKGSL